MGRVQNGRVEPARLQLVRVVRFLEDCELRGEGPPVPALLLPGAGLRRPQQDDDARHGLLHQPPAAQHRAARRRQLHLGS